MNVVNQIAPSELTPAVHRTCDESNGLFLNFGIQDNEIGIATHDVRIKTTTLIVKCFLNELRCADNI